MRLSIEDEIGSGVRVESYQVRGSPEVVTRARTFLVGVAVSVCSRVGPRGASIISDRVGAFT
jgi:hypothetical protein